MEYKFIDRNYYTQQFDSQTNAKIFGAFTRAAENNANFNSFVEQGSILFDRMTGGKVHKLGSFELLPAFPYACGQKFVALMVQHWFQRGFDLQTINQSVSNASITAQKTVDVNAFRDIIPLNALSLLQLSGLWDKKMKAITTKEHIKLGLADIVLWQDAVNIFQQKGINDSFYPVIDFTSALTGTNGDRWIKIVDTPLTQFAFDIRGGYDDDIAISTVWVDTASQSKGEVFFQSIDPLATAAHEVFVNENQTTGNVEVFVKVKDNQKSTEFVISNVYNSQKGDYGFLGTQDTAIGTLLPSANILKDVDLTALSQQITAVQNQLSNINPQLTQITTNADAITAIEDDLPFILQDIINLKASRTTQNQNITKNTNDISGNTGRISTLENDVLKKDGSVLVNPSFTPTADRHIVYKKFVEDAIAAQLAANPSLSGFEMEWVGSEGTVRDTVNADRVKIDTTSLAPQKGTKDFTNNKRVELTILNTVSDTEDTVITRIGNDGKFDNIDTDEEKDDIRASLNIDTNGVITFRNIDYNNQQEKTIPTDKYVLVAMHQINGLVYGQAATTPSMDDTTIAELEGVSI